MKSSGYTRPMSVPQGQCPTYIQEKSGKCIGGRLSSVVESRKGAVKFEGGTRFENWALDPSVPTVSPAQCKCSRLPCPACQDYVKTLSTYALQHGVCQRFHVMIVEGRGSITRQCKYISPTENSCNHANVTVGSKFVISMVKAASEIEESYLASLVQSGAQNPWKSMRINAGSADTDLEISAMFTSSLEITLERTHGKCRLVSQFEVLCGDGKPPENGACKTKSTCGEVTVDQVNGDGSAESELKIEVHGTNTMPRMVLSPKNSTQNVPVMYTNKTWSAKQTLKTGSWKV